VTSRTGSLTDRRSITVTPLSLTFTSCSKGQNLDAEHIWPSFERKAKHKGIDPARFCRLLREADAAMEGPVAG